jgi:8-oxo-dGTP pyrophosphatase MutT (NUDIX family)
MTKYPLSICLILRFGEDHVALARRKKGYFKGCWEAPGGKVDKGESLTSAAIRETNEETSYYPIRQLIECLGCITEHPTVDKHFVFEHSDDFGGFVRLKNPEKDKRTDWQLFTRKEALKLKLMPGLELYI